MFDMEDSKSKKKKARRKRKNKKKKEHSKASAKNDLLNSTGANDMHSLFKQADKDGSGSLEKNEVRRLMKQMGKNLSKAEFEVAFSKIDVDGSGAVDFDEFVEFGATSDRVFDL